MGAPAGHTRSHWALGRQADKQAGAHLSMMRLTHSSCSTLSGCCPPSTAPTNAVTSATRFTVSCGQAVGVVLASSGLQAQGPSTAPSPSTPSLLRQRAFMFCVMVTSRLAQHTHSTCCAAPPHTWNCRNLRMLLNTERPQSTDLTMEEKLSSRMMMSAASLATSVPARHIHTRRHVCTAVHQLRYKAVRFRCITSQAQLCIQRRRSRGWMTERKFPPRLVSDASLAAQV